MSFDQTGVLFDDEKQNKTKKHFETCFRFILAGAGM